MTRTRRLACVIGLMSFIASGCSDQKQVESQAAPASSIECDTKCQERQKAAGSGEFPTVDTKPDFRSR